MAEITVKKSEDGSGWSVEVQVKEGGSQTSHTVAVSQADFKRYGKGASSVEDLIKRSFEFLLERESKESIMSRFELPVISRYFPEYEREIVR